MLESRIDHSQQARHHAKHAVSLVVRAEGIKRCGAFPAPLQFGEIHATGKQAGQRGVHHLYANPKAVAGYKSGKFPDGAIIVFDLLEAKSADNAVTEGARKVVGVMHKDAKKFTATGGWGFEGFGGGDKTNRVVRDNAASACFACHESQKNYDYVFSRLRD